MAYRVQLELPRVVQAGQAQTLTLPVVSDASAAQTASGGALTVTAGGSTLLDGVALTSTGPPASYSLLAATTTGLNPTESWVETWTLTGLGVFLQTGYLCNQAYYSHVTDSTLQAIHPELLDLLPAGEVTAQKCRTAASAWIQRQLLNLGRRPWLVWDQWALIEPEQWYALGLWANDAALRTTGSGVSADYRQRALEYRDRADAEFRKVAFRYDGDQTGTIDPTITTTAAPAMLQLSAGRPGSWAWRGGYQQW